MPEPVAGTPVTEPQSDRTVNDVSVRRVLPLYSEPRR